MLFYLKYDNAYFPKLKYFGQHLEHKTRIRISGCELTYAGVWLQARSVNIVRNNLWRSESRTLCGLDINTFLHRKKMPMSYCSQFGPKLNALDLGCAAPL